MSVLEKPKQITTVIVRGRKLKGNKMGRFLPLPLKFCEHIGIEPGDMLEIEIKKLSRKAEVEIDFPSEKTKLSFAHPPTRTIESEQTHTAQNEDELGIGLSN